MGIKINISDKILDVNLDKLKQDKINELNLKCSDDIEKGTLCNNGNFYRFNKEEDQINFSQQLLEIIDGTASDVVYWKTENNGIIVHSHEEFKIVFRELGDYKKQLIAKYWQLKYNILSVTTIQEIRNIVW